jgi:hypothetical protein
LDLRIEFAIPLNIRTWQRTWSITDFMDALTEAALETQSEVDVHDPTCNSHGAVGAECYIGFPIHDLSRRAYDVLHDEMPVVIQLLDRTAGRLDARTLQQTLLRTYRFPPQISGAACEYLRYFVQFLSDLGIDAHSDLKQRAGVVIFKVTPTSQSEALRRIAEALRIYLNLPFMPEFAAASEPFQDVAVVELRRAVQGLQSQLLRARADINVLQIISQYPQLSLPAVVAASLPVDDSYSPLPVPAESDHEPLFGGVLNLKKFEFNGGDIDLAGLLRRLKRAVQRLLGTRPGC